MSNDRGMNATAAPSGRLWKWLAGLAAFVVVAAAGVVVWGAASGGVSAGPRGDASPTPGEAAQTGPTPASTDGPRGPSGELGWDDIERLGLGAPGDGGFALSGPNVFASGEPDQTFYILVGNAAKPKSTYTVVAVIDGDQEVTVEVTLAGYARELVPVVFSAVDLGAGEVPLELTLSSDGMGQGLDARSETLIGMDLDDPAERETLANSIEAARVHPYPPDDLVLAVLDKMMAEGALADGN